MVGADNMMVVGTADRKVVVMAKRAKQAVWETDVDGEPFGLAVADGRLYVSTARGTIYCYGKKAPSEAARIEFRVASNPYGANAKYAEAGGGDYCEYRNHGRLLRGPWVRRRCLGL